MLYSRNWLEQARRAYHAATSLRAADDHAYCCFMSQQTAEMALKAALEHLAQDHMGHNLLDLLSTLGTARPGSVTDDLRSAGRRLNRLYIPTRYPDAVGGSVPADNYAAEDADRALADAKSVLDFVADSLMAEDV